MGSKNGSRDRTMFLSGPQGHFVVCRLGLAMLNLHCIPNSKSLFTHYADMKAMENVKVYAYVDVHLNFKT